MPVYAADVARKCVSYGIRYLGQRADYYLERGLAAPDRVGLTLTHRCNCRCVMCDLWKWDDHARELPAERWLRILEELHDWIGSFRLALNGGEIFLKPGVYEIIRRAVELGLTINPVSNGLVFRSDHHLHNLLSTGLKSITFSLDGRDPEVHDRHRGRSGLHTAVAEVIRQIKREKPRMSVSVLCIIMRETAAQLADFARWAEELGVDNILFQPIADVTGRAEKRSDWYEASDLFVKDLDALGRSFDELIQLKTTSDKIELTSGTLRAMQEYFARPAEFQIKGRRCMLGQTDLRVNPEGIVYICDVRHTTIGHVDDGPLCDIWTGRRAREVRRLIKQCHRPCTALCHRSPGLRERVMVFLRYARAGRL